MDRKPKIDFTPEQWFVRHKNVRHNNLLLEYINNFDYLQAFGQNNLNSMTKYIGAHNYLDKLSGYEMTWDSKHVCDRCGCALDESGAAKNVRLAWALGKDWMKGRIGLCSGCERDMEYFTQDDNEFSKAYWKNKSSMPNDWLRYAWL